MTGGTGCRPDRDELTARVFSALYPEFDLHGGWHARGGPAGNSVVRVAHSLGDVARQISGHEQRRAGGRD